MAVCAAAWMMLGASGAASIGLVAGPAILCGGALRRGLRPIHIGAALIVAFLADDLHVLHSGMQLELHMLARAFIKSGANTALATLAFIAVPRRSAYFAPRSRTRLDHILFMAV